MKNESNYLAHYGVKGMKWGVRKKPQYTYSVYRKNSRFKTGANHAKMMNNIFDSLSENQKTLIVPRYREDKSKKMMNEGDSFPVLSVIKKYWDTPVSFAAAWDSGKGVGEIGLATDSRYQGKGIASKTVKKFMKEFGKTKISDIKTLNWTAWETNESSKKLAIKSGFKFDSKNNGWETYKYSI